MNPVQRNAPQIDELSFRRSMAVTTVLLYRAGEAYPICPRCSVTMEREYQKFCDRCGQRLDWSKFHQAAVITRN